jgi:hypothetical protein
MKKIVIRFIERKDKFRIQRKTWYGRWKNVTYVVELGYIPIEYSYSGNTKEEVLNVVLENYYKVDKRFVEIAEYPTIKIY